MTEFRYRYPGSSSISQQAQATHMSMMPDTLRQPTYFSGQLAHHQSFREAICALHDVVISDLRYVPKDRSEYQAWLAGREREELAEIADMQAGLAERVARLKGEHDALKAKEFGLRAPFLKARKQYWDWLYKHDRDLWYVLDPVITVHPDELFFECFSNDESTYGRLSCDYQVFKHVGEFACGTTNIDYSEPLYQEFRKIRSYKDTQFEIDPSGFEVTTGDANAYKEVKIDLPDSWVRGFLQVSTAMTLPARLIELAPIDIHNICHILRRNREQQGPRSLRFKLTPGEPISIVFEPWNIELECPLSRYLGDQADEIRVWGRRRLHILERLIPVANKFSLYLLGTGMPSFFIAHLPHMTFTLGLSGWTSNDWSHAGNFDLMAPRGEVDQQTKERVFEALKTCWFDTPSSLAKRLDLEPKLVNSALTAYTQAGRVMYDLDKKVFRARELSREPLPAEQLRFANPREAEGRRLLEQGYVIPPLMERDQAGNMRITAQVKETLPRSGKVKFHETSLTINKDEALRQASCTCDYFFRNRLYKGPCEHILATRMAYARQTKGGRLW